MSSKPHIADSVSAPASYADPETGDCRALAGAIADALGQLGGVIASLDAAQFCCRTCDPAFGATVGRHVRHVLDHVAAIERAALPSPTGLAHHGGESVADYEARARDSSIEREPRLALAEIARLRARMGEIAPLRPGQPATILIAVRRDEPKASIPSTLARELSFILSHTIHHHAILRSMLCELGIAGTLHPDFGLAPGTPIDHASSHHH